MTNPQGRLRGRLICLRPVSALPTEKKILFLFIHHHFTQGWDTASDWSAVEERKWLFESADQTFVGRERVTNPQGRVRGRLLSMPPDCVTD